MTKTIEHDRLFKELLSTFFFEFLELFLPDLASTIDIKSIRFLPQEYFADLRGCLKSQLVGKKALSV
ncbi:MAG: hypothetical protein KME11_08280 [Timaviella obliquedivisa GSE-PSE-MK23-08B]|jgi:hypothetical protein|nr:hypothetical protein [Timaviella obliquedivisa GSE-PSE-MK23-08B]